MRNFGGEENILIFWQVTKFFILKFALEQEWKPNFLKNCVFPEKSVKSHWTWKCFLQQEGLSEVTCAYMLNWKSASPLGPLFSLITISHEILPSRSLNRPKSALMKHRIVILLFVLFPSLGILNSTISVTVDLTWLSQLSLTFTAPASSFLFVSIGSSRASPLISFSVTYVRKLSSVCAGISCTACALLCCPFNRYWSNIANLISETYEILWQSDKIWDFAILFLVVHHGKHNGNQTVVVSFQSHTSSTAQQAEGATCKLWLSNLKKKYSMPLNGHDMKQFKKTSIMSSSVGFTLQITIVLPNNFYSSFSRCSSNWAASITSSRMWRTFSSWIKFV